MEVEPKQVAADYWRYHQLCGGNRQDRLAAEASPDAVTTMDDLVWEGPIPTVLELIDELLAHPLADTAYVGAGPVEDLLRREDIEGWDSEIAQRCRTSEAWREAVDGAIPPDGLVMPGLRPYLRVPRPEPVDAAKPARIERGSRREGRQPGRHRR